MAISRADRRENRGARARAGFGVDAEAVLDVLELTEFAWHDCYGETSPPEAVIDDVFVVAKESLKQFIRAHVWRSRTTETCGWRLAPFEVDACFCGRCYVPATAP